MLAGVATLILAIGVGFMIGRTFHEGGPTAIHDTERITIEPGGGAPRPESRPRTPAPEIAPKHGQGAEGGHEPGTEPGHAPKAQGSPGDGAKEQEEVHQQETERVLHPTVPLPKPKAQIGETCTPGTAGCGKNHKFEGEFFPAEE